MEIHIQFLKKLTNALKKIKVEVRVHRGDRNLSALVHAQILFPNKIHICNQIHNNTSRQISIIKQNSLFHIGLKHA